MEEEAAPATPEPNPGLLYWYRVGREQAQRLDDQRLRQYQILLDARNGLLEARRRRDAAREARVAGQLLTELDEDVRWWSEAVEHADSGLRVLNAERDRFHVDRRAALSLLISLGSLTISLLAFLTAIVALATRK